MVTAVNKTTEDTASPPGTTALAEPSTSQGVIKRARMIRGLI
jgi:hypothetical protein